MSKQIRCTSSHGVSDGALQSKCPTPGCHQKTFGAICNGCRAALAKKTFGAKAEIPPEVCDTDARAPSECIDTPERLAAKNIQTLLNHIGRDKAWLVMATGLSLQTIRRAMKGEKKTRAMTRFLIFEALGLDNPGILAWRYLSELGEPTDLVRIKTRAYARETQRQKEQKRLAHIPWWKRALAWLKARAR